jgi:hypothetical protein
VLVLVLLFVVVVEEALGLARRSFLLSSARSARCGAQAAANLHLLRVALTRTSYAGMASGTGRHA